MIDTERLALEIQGMKRSSKLFRVLKTELSKLGYWRNRPRGDPSKGFQSMKNKMEV